MVDIGSGQGELAVLLAPRSRSLKFVGWSTAQPGWSEHARWRPGQGRVEAHVQPKRPSSTSGPPGIRARLGDRRDLLRGLGARRLAGSPPGEFDGVSGARVSHHCHCPGWPSNPVDRHIGHRTHFTKRSLRDLLDSSGFDVLEVRQAGFPFFNLYKLVVLLRGKALIAELDQGDSSPPSRLAGAVLRIFDLAFRWNLPSSPFGWQLIAVATPKLAQ